MSMRRVIMVSFHKGNMWMFVKCLLCTRHVTGNAPLLRADAKGSPSVLQVSNKRAPATLWLYLLLFSFPLPTLGTKASLFLKHAIQAPTLRTFTCALLSDIHMTDSLHL